MDNDELDPEQPDRWYLRYGVMQLPAGVFYDTEDEAQRVADTVPPALGPATVHKHAVV